AHVELAEGAGLERAAGLRVEPGGDGAGGVELEALRGERRAGLGEERAVAAGLVEADAEREVEDARAEELAVARQALAARPGGRVRGREPGQGGGAVEGAPLVAAEGLDEAGLAAGADEAVDGAGVEAEPLELRLDRLLLRRGPGHGRAQR